MLLALATAAAAGCSSDSTGLSLPDIVGTWHATKFEFVAQSSPSTKTDLVTLGGPATVVLRTDNTFTITLNAPGQQPIVSNGSWTETATTLTIIITSETPAQTVTFTLDVSGSTMSLTGGVATFNFGAGDVPAFLNVTLVKS
jgi:hypothetical protein